MTTRTWNVQEDDKIFTVSEYRDKQTREVECTCQYLALERYATCRHIAYIFPNTAPHITTRGLKIVSQKEVIPPPKRWVWF